LVPRLRERSEGLVKGHHRFHRTAALLVLVLAGWLWPSDLSPAKLRDDTLKGWKQYQKLTEERIERELDSGNGFLVRDFLPDSEATVIRTTLAAGRIFIEKMQTPDEEGGKIRIPKGLVHHWYGSVLLPGAAIDDVLAWEQDYASHQNFFEEVEESRLLSRRGDVFEISLRLRRKKLITVHYTTEHVVTYRRWGADKVTSRSEATRIVELQDPGTDREREKSAGNDRGYMWRLDSYWRFKQEPEGVVVECESISLSRTIPVAFRWVVKPFITSVPKESLEATLRPLRDAFINLPH
jgi:hypothetical protein